jgi:hypothetical protein
MITVPSTSIYMLMNKIRNSGSLMDTNAAKKCRQTRKILLTQFFTVPKAIQNTVINPLAYTAACEAAGLARSINTQPAVRRNSETNPTSQHNNVLKSIKINFA